MGPPIRLEKQKTDSFCQEENAVAALDPSRCSLRLNLFYN
jgi:hypothetical protein